MTTESQGKEIKMAHSKSLYSCRMAQKTEMIALCALINSVYRGESAKGGWTTEADLLDGQRCDLTMLKELVTRPNSGFLVICNTEEIVACCHLQLAEAEVAECGMLSVTPTWQNQGVANVLLHTAEEYARGTWQAQHMRLWVIKQRPELAAYYQRRGYQFTGATLPFPDDSRYGIPKVAGLCLLAMEKALTLPA
ncbi:MAG: GNAT family N-acetyltransferase [Acidithiobacillus ferriphilus]|jgi:Acetyltransferase (GNAT) family.|nr:GNAT family N-acetyltransferase [Acidithiobacillus ferriphilus]MBU2784456.1 GNAT family N-acetyltransferase [Acidithiobacillus ferriphilus]MBU2828529.1 GNAT family N-acetyltransferase [Acidithiobacillus ferriphilus]UEP60229.1 GNAT family N-acetyltransferase [Acidithiobacillus ferriphilus]